VQAGVPACSLTLIVRPATVAVPVRCDDVLALVESVTEPDPDPPGPTAIQLAPLPVVHAQPAEVVTLMVVEPPPEPKLEEVGVTAKLHVVPDADAVKLATVARLFLSARALSCVEVPVRRPA
jgi:hypothetical protein